MTNMYAKFRVHSSGGSRIFPRGGREPSRGGVNTPNFPENCMKSKEFGCPGGACVPHAPPRSANAFSPRAIIDCRIDTCKRVFHKYTTLAIMPILASEALLRKNKKSGNKMLPLMGIETTGLGF